MKPPAAEVKDGEGPALPNGRLTLPLLLLLGPLAELFLGAEWLTVWVRLWLQELALENVLCLPLRVLSLVPLRRCDLLLLLPAGPVLPPPSEKQFSTASGHSSD